MAEFLEGTLTRRFPGAVRLRYFRAEDDVPSAVAPLVTEALSQNRTLPVVYVDGRLVAEGAVRFQPVIAAVEAAVHGGRTDRPPSE